MKVIAFLLLASFIKDIKTDNKSFISDGRVPQNSAEETVKQGDRGLPVASVGEEEAKISHCLFGGE